MSEEGRVAKAIEATDIAVDWEFEGGNPGYARFAIEVGPLARVMEIDESGRTEAGSQYNGLKIKINKI